jgi:hypothetical protein
MANPKHDVPPEWKEGGLSYSSGLTYATAKGQGLYGCLWQGADPDLARHCAIREYSSLILS